MKTSAPRRIGAALAVCCCVQLAPAERKPAAAGLLGGMNVASLWGGDVHDVDVRFWPVAGFSVAFHFPQFLGLETDLLYASRGSVFKDQVPQVPAQAPPETSLVHIFKAHTLTIPILLKITAPIAGEVKPIFFGGPAVAYFLSKSGKSEKTYVGPNNMIVTDTVSALIPTDRMADFDVLLTVGGGLEWGLGSLQIRLNLGQKSLDARNQRDVKTVTLEAMAGFIF